MLAIDTNIVVRLLINDDPEQVARTREILSTNEVFVPTTVILETAWVLSRGFGYSRERLVYGLRSISGLNGLFLEEPEAVYQAIDWLSQGMDFADALHLAKSKGCDGLLTFDKAFAKRAGQLGQHGVQLA